MFTGCIEELGIVKGIEKGYGSIRLTVSGERVSEEIRIGDSIAVNGVCLTVTGVEGKTFMVDISPETIRVSDIGNLKRGDRVNVEQALRLADRLNGHIVSGHIDGIGVIKRRDLSGNIILLYIEIPVELLRYCITKGSIAIDGVSLTINEISNREISVSIIPYTAGMTTLGIKGPEDRVNIETDQIAKYIENIVMDKGIMKNRDNIDLELLERYGFIRS